MKRLALLLAALSACYDPAIDGGGLRCSVDGECPGGYHCDRDSFCWKDGQSPPATAPGIPQQVHAVTGARAATVTWFVPSTDGGSPITGYRITVSPGAITQDAPATASSAVFSGLVEEATYTFTIVAVNAVGESAAATSVPLRIAGVPPAPDQVSAVAGVRSAIVAWHASNPNGSPVTSYTVVATPGGATTVVAGDATSAEVAGLDNATQYTFAITAANLAGTGPAAISPAVDTPAVPTPPLDLHAIAGSGSIALDWAPPADNGGTNILSYSVSISPSGGTLTQSAYSATISGLSPGTPFTVSVFASNAAGDGAPASTGPLVPR